MDVVLTRISYSAVPAMQYLHIGRELGMVLRYSSFNDHRDLLQDSIVHMAVRELRWRCRGLLPSRWPVMFPEPVRWGEESNRRKKTARGNHGARSRRSEVSSFGSATIETGRGYVKLLDSGRGKCFQVCSHNLPTLSLLHEMDGIYIHLLLQ